MRDGWVETTLAAVAEVNPKEGPLSEEADFVPMDAVEAGGRWVTYTEPRGTRSGARARGGDTLFARITPCLENGKIGQVPPAIERVGGSTELIVLRAGPTLLPDFLFFWARSDGTRAAAEALMSGTTGRQRVSAADLSSLPITVPPIAEQRRIVDLIDAVDGTLTTSIKRKSEALRVQTALIADWADNHAQERAAIGDLATLGSGPSWKADAEAPAPTPGAVRVLGITNTPSDRTISLDNETYVVGLPARTALLRPESLLMIRTNGNRSRIGNVYRVPDAAVGCAFSAFQIGLHFNTAADAEFAFWMLSDSRVQAAISANASGTTGLGNVAVSWLRQFEIPWPVDGAVREEALALFGDVDAAFVAASAVVDALWQTRAALVSELLSGKHEIPDSYDALLESVA